MGPDDLIPVVADAGPLMHLSDIGALDLLRAFGPIHIPSKVWAESVERGPVDGERLMALEVVEGHLLSALEVSEFVRAEQIGNLQRAEQECLFLARQLGVNLLLTDDLLGRTVAKRLGLTPIGSAGVIARAFHRGWIPLVTAERYLIELYDTSLLFVTRAVAEVAGQTLRRPTGKAEG